MAILRVKDDNGNIIEIPAIKGDKGDKGNGIADAVLNSDYTLTLTFTDGTSYTTPPIRGATGATGATGAAGADGADGSDGSDGKDGADGTSVTVVSVSESTADGGSNVVTFSDGKTVTIKNGSKGSTGATGADGYTPVKGTDYWTPADKEEIVQEVITALGTPVFGTVDADNNIILTGELADGTYTLKYEDAEGNVVEIGTLTNGSDEPVTTNIPLNIELGIKLSKTDDSYTTVSTDHTSVTETYGASQYIDLDSNAVYKIGMGFSNWKGVSLCFFDANNNMVSYESNVIYGPSNNTPTPAEYTIVIPSNAVKVRLRVYLKINASNSASYVLSQSELWMTKTI